VFDRLLIANRGEIACRIIRTARRLGCHAIAVYSDADARAAHVALADEAHRIGPPPARESYLSIERLLAAAQRSRAQAIHPGYGFLSESAEFARACEDAGLVFVGPPAQAIAALGSKARARQHMVAAGVPVVPGYHGEDTSPQALLAAAEAIGFPLLVKAAAGGGGKGMQVVASPAELVGAVEAVRRIAASAFGDDRVLLERCVERPRHVEVQVFADRHGNVVHLLEPKGVMHTTGGYLTFCAYSHKMIFDYKENDVYWCTADIVWVTGHTYIVYGPLCNGATSVLFEGIPSYPAPDRFWSVIEKYKVNIFYTAPLSGPSPARVTTG